MSETSRTKGIYLDTAPAPVFGSFHAPSGDSRGRVGVLFCPPFGWEDYCSYRSRRAWADHVAGRGLPALRIDLPATGDSAGSPRDPALLDGWTDAVGGAADWLRATAGCSRVAAIGIGIGGLIALRAAQAGNGPDDLVLWAVPARGAALVRELRAFAMLNADIDPMDAARQPRTAEPQRQSAGSLEVGGFLLTAETLAGLEAVDLTAAALPPGSDCRVLMLERDGIGVDRRLRRHLEDTGVGVSVAPGPGYTGMIAHPQEARPPLAEFSAVDDWLATLPCEPDTSPPRGAPASTQALQLGSELGGIREAEIEVKRPFGRLRGVLTAPAEGPPAPLCAVLVNAGALRRIGPGRMWVDTAREWAARGVPTARIDLEGIGDADGDGSAYRDTAALYVPRLIEQTIAALDELVRQGLPPRFVLVGLCSGAYWSFHAAVQDERVRAAYLINPRTLSFDPAIENNRRARKTSMALRASSWRRFLRGEIPVSSVRAAARGGVDAALRPRALAAVRKRHRDELDAALESLRASETKILLAFGGNEPLRDELAREGRLEGLAARPEIDLIDLPGSDHTLRPISTQREARGRLDQALSAELQRAASG